MRDEVLVADRKPEVQASAKRPAATVRKPENKIEDAAYMTRELLRERPNSEKLSRNLGNQLEQYQVNTTEKNATRLEKAIRTAVNSVSADLRSAQQRYLIRNEQIDRRNYDGKIPERVSESRANEAKEGYFEVYGKKEGYSTDEGKRLEGKVEQIKLSLKDNEQLKENKRLLYREDLSVPQQKEPPARSELEQMRYDLRDKIGPVGRIPVNLLKEVTERAADRLDRKERQEIASAGTMGETDNASKLKYAAVVVRDYQMGKNAQTINVGIMPSDQERQRESGIREDLRRMRQEPSAVNAKLLETSVGQGVRAMREDYRQAEYKLREELTQKGWAPTSVDKEVDKGNFRLNYGQNNSNEVKVRINIADSYLKNYQKDQQAGNYEQDAKKNVYEVEKEDRATPETTGGDGPSRGDSTKESQFPKLTESDKEQYRQLSEQFEREHRNINQKEDEVER